MWCCTAQSPKSQEGLTARAQESRKESSFSMEFIWMSSFLGQKRSSRKLLDKWPCKHAASTQTHKFVCLSCCAQNIIPTTDREKDALYEVGLGEKKIVVEDIDCSGEDFCELLYVAFLKFKDSGVFIFSKCMSNSQFLEPLSSMSLTSLRDLDLMPCHLPPGVRLAIINVNTFVYHTCIYSLWRDVYHLLKIFFTVSC